MVELLEYWICWWFSALFFTPGKSSEILWAVKNCRDYADSFKPSRQRRKIKSPNGRPARINFIRVIFSCLPSEPSTPRYTLNSARHEFSRIQQLFDLVPPWQFKIPRNVTEHSEKAENLPCQSTQVSWRGSPIINRLARLARLSRLSRLSQKAWYPTTHLISNRRVPTCLYLTLNPICDYHTIPSHPISKFSSLFPLSYLRMLRSTLIWMWIFHIQSD